MDITEQQRKKYRDKVIEAMKTDIDRHTLLSDSFSIREFAERKIYRCKESAYGKNTNASNISEGDYGTWDDWQNVLEEFAVFVLKNYKLPRVNTEKQ